MRIHTWPLFPPAFLLGPLKWETEISEGSPRSPGSILLLALSAAPVIAASLTSQPGGGQQTTYPKTGSSSWRSDLTSRWLREWRSSPRWAVSTVEAHYSSLSFICKLWMLFISTWFKVQLKWHLWNFFPRTTLAMYKMLHKYLLFRMEDFWTSSIPTLWSLSGKLGLLTEHEY